jgi:hypothetical protein
MRCRACGTRSVLAGVEAPSRFQVLPRVERDAAVRTVRTALSKWPVRDGTADRAAVVAADLVWVPFWEYEAVQAGTVLRSRGMQTVRTGRVDWSQGRRRFLDPEGREISESEHYKLRSVEVQDTAVVLRTHRSTGVAAGPRDWGLQAIDVAAIRDDPDVRIVPRGSPEAPAGHFLAPVSGRREAESEVLRIVGAGSRAEFDLLAPDLRYLFVPVWVVRLRVDRHPYAFVVDAVHGRILSGRAPEAPRRGALFVVLAAAYLGFPVGKIVATLVAGSGSGLGHVLEVAFPLVAELGVVSLGVLAFLLFPLAFAWGEFRFRGEVAFGPGGATVVKSSRPQRTFLERVIDRLSEMADRALQASSPERSGWGRDW